MTLSYGWNLQQLQHSRNKITTTHAHNCLRALCPELLGWAGTRRNIHPLTFILDSWSSNVLYQLHLLRSIASSVLVYVLGSPFSWYGFATAYDRKWLQAVVRHGIHSGLCEQHHRTVKGLVEEAYDKVFSNVIYNKQHAYIPHLLIPWTQNITLGLDPITLTLP